MLDSTPCFASNYTNLRKYITRRFFNSTLPGVDSFSQALVACKITKGDSGGGLFYWDSSDLSAEVTADPTSETYVAPNSDLTGASGSWVRQPITLFGDLDANYKQLLNSAIHNDVIANIPTTGNEVEGQMFLANDICTLFLYCDGIWNAQQSFDAVTLYVDSTGTNAPGFGYASGAGAYATCQYAFDALPAQNGGNVIIYVAAGTHTENLFLGGKKFSGAFTITFIGEFTSVDTGEITAGTAGAVATQGTITKATSFGAYTNYIIYDTGSGSYRIIDSISGAVVSVVGYYTTTPSGNYTVYDWATVIHGTHTIDETQTGIKFERIKFTKPNGGSIYMWTGSALSSLYTNYCSFDTSANTDTSLYSYYSIFNGANYIDDHSLHIGNSAKSHSGIIAQTGNSILVNQCKYAYFNQGITCNGDVNLTMNGVNSSNVLDYCKTGIVVTNGALANLNGGYNRIRNAATAGIKRSDQYSNVFYGTGHVLFSGNTADLTYAGNILFNTTTETLKAIAPSATIVPFKAKAAASQSANVSEFLDSADAVMSAVAKNGAFKPPSLADASAENNTIYYSTTASKLVYKDGGGVVNALY